MAHYVYNKTLGNIVKCGKVFNFIDVGCTNLGEFYDKGWQFADSLEEAVKGMGGEK